MNIILLVLAQSPRISAASASALQTQKIENTEPWLNTVNTISGWQLEIRKGETIYNRHYKPLFGSSILYIIHPCQRWHYLSLFDYGTGQESVDWLFIYLSSEEDYNNTVHKSNFYYQFKVMNLHICICRLARCTPRWSSPSRDTCLSCIRSKSSCEQNFAELRRTSYFGKLI